MKILNIFKQILATVIVLIGSSCSDFLEEENRTFLSDENALQTAEDYDALVANTYFNMRPTIQNDKLDFLGTDIFTRQSLISGTNELNDYVNLATTNGDVSNLWEDNYDLIAAANLVISRTSEIPSLTSAEISVGEGQAQFMRAYAYFNLVEHFGGVPLVLEEITTSVSDFSKNSEQEVFTQIIIDLDDAIAGLDETPEQYGRVSKDAARHLKAKVLLTRGYKSFGTSSDFTDAASLAESVITNHDLVGDFADLMDINNQRNSEVIFALLYGDNSSSIGIGNDRHQYFKFTYDVYPGMERSAVYNGGIGNAPTPFFYTLFEDDDEREAATIRRMIPALIDSDDATVLAGDTAIYFPKVAFSDALKATKAYVTINEGDYYTANGFSQVQYPMFRKFDDPSVGYRSGMRDNGEGGGFRDATVMRSGETRLIAAEAYFNSGNSAGAATHINALRNRAGLTNDVLATDVDLDLILDESAKELAGEVSRWMELKRTGKLIERTLANNPHAALNNALSTMHMVRPIPQSEIDVVGGSLTQNDGYQ